MDLRDKIKQYVEANKQGDRIPTIRDIGKALGIKSTSHVHYHLKRLGQKQGRKYPEIFSTDMKAVRHEIIRLLGGRCARCGYEDIRALQIDHIGGGGTRERIAKNQRGMYVKMYVEVSQGRTGEYQVLCANCNWIKRYVNGE